jgi:hypothetical protein
MKSRIAKILFIASVLSFLVSLCLPAFYDARSPQAWYGLGALLNGMFGLFGGYYCWLANPLILMAWIAAFIKRPMLMIGGSLLSCVLCLSFLCYHHVEDEVGETAIVGLGPGYWLWLTSPVLMFFYGLLSLKKKEVSQVT